MIFTPYKLDFSSTESVKTFQEKRLSELLSYVSSNSKFYKELFELHLIDTSTIRTLEDLQKLPVTTKEDLHFKNQDFVCVPKTQIIDYITTSGTLGDPVTFALTDNDLNRLAYNEASSFEIAEGNKEEIYQLMTTIDKRFMAGLAYFLGARKLGAGIVRVGGGIPELQWDTINRILPSTLIVVPSFILKLIDYAEKNGIDYRSSSIKRAICIGESLRNEDFSLNTLGQKIREKWDIKLHSTYASTEMGTAFTECEAGRGGHHQPDLIIVEFLDESNIPVKAGEAGEVTITTLGLEGMPLIRFKTGDVCNHYTEICECGRTTIRLGPVIGRKKQMIKFKGTTLYPPALYDILNGIDQVKSYVIEIYTNEIGTDEILILVNSTDESERFEKEIKDHFRAKLRVAPRVKFMDEITMKHIKYPETSRKPIELIDSRKN